MQTRLFRVYKLYDFREAQGPHAKFRWKVGRDKT